MTATRAFIALGSNLGDRARSFAMARERLEALDDATIVAATEPVETAPLGGLDQPAYLNAMLLLRWRADAEALLAACQHIESAAGRRRDVRWGSRELDLDLVRFGSMLCDRPGLVLPHPGLRDREFWARQLAELESHA